MKTKIILMFLLTTFLSLLSLTMVSAVVDLITISKGPVLSQSNNATYFEISANPSNTRDINLDDLIIDTPLKINDGRDHYMTITLGPLTKRTLSKGEKERIDVSVTVDPGFNFRIKTYNFPVIKVKAVDSVDNTQIETEEVTMQFLKTFCNTGERGTSLVISDVSIDNKDGEDKEWVPLNEIKIEVEVSNEGEDKVKDVIVELGLFNSEGKNIVKDLEDLNEKKIELGRINEDKDKTALFTFKVPSEFEDDNYILVIKAYSDDVGEKNLCVAHSLDIDDNYFQVIVGERETDEDNHVVVNNIIISPATAQCGERVQVSATVYNIGDEDYEDQVSVTLKNKDLEIDLEQVIRENFDQGDSETLDFEFDVPKGAEEKLYVLEFRTLYDYDTKDESYALISDKKFTKSLPVKGNCGLEQKEAEEATNIQISAELDPETPEVIAGKKVIIKTTLKNTGDVKTTYTLSVQEHSTWSTLGGIEPQSVITLEKGESKDVSIILNVDSDAEGEKNFTIVASFDGKEKKYEVKGLSINKAEDIEVEPLVEHLRRNWFIYVIIIINIILIIAIIAVVRSMVRARPL